MNLGELADRAEVEPALVEIPAALAKHLGELADLGAYGPTIADVAVYLLRREVDDLTRVGVIVPVRDP